MVERDKRVTATGDAQGVPPSVPPSDLASPENTL
jgi:hypothetical protein